MEIVELIIKILNSKWLFLSLGIIFGILLPVTYSGMTTSWNPFAIIVFVMNLIIVGIAMFKFMQKITEKKKPKNQQWEE
jgi:hypothetical protein